MASAAARDHAAQLARRLVDAAAAGDVAGILAMMRECEADADTQAACCFALAQMVQRDADIMADTTLFPELLEAVFSGLRAHAADESLTLKSRILMLRVLDTPHHVSQALAMGAAEIMVTVMCAQRDCAGAQSACCEVLHRLAALADFGLRAGVVRAVLAALTTHKSAQVSALLTLQRLLSHKANALEALAAGALEAVVSLLRAHASASDGVVTAACCTLRELVTHLDVADTATRLGAVGALVSVLHRGAALTGKSDLSFAACNALELLVFRSMLACTAAGSCGAVEAVLAVVRTHSTAARLQEFGWLTLAVLFHHDAKHAATARNADALALVVAVLRDHFANADAVYALPVRRSLAWS
jgi:hypothetical protein